MLVKAIETRYAGCRFRSRLEARWAVFFDRLGIGWEYEPQGYQVGESRRAYLPDFWLPDDGLWVEVKGSEQQLDHRLLVDATIPHYGLPANPSGQAIDDPSHAGRRMLILGSLPRPAGRPAHSVLSFWEGDVYRSWAEFDVRGVVIHDTYGMNESVGNDSGDLFPPSPGLLGPAYFDGRTSRYTLEAYTAARSARFEHGEAA